MVLNCDEDGVMFALGEVGGLLADLRRVVERLEDPGASDLLAHFGADWANVVFTPDRKMGQGSSDLVAPGGLAALGVLSSLLTSTASEGTVVDLDHVVDLRDSLNATLQEVRADTEIPADIRAILVARLHDMLWAIDHLTTVGAQGVKAAAERLAGAMAIRPDPTDRQRPIVQKVLAAAGRAWTFFTLGPKAQQSLEGWNEVIGQIGPGPS